MDNFKLPRGVAVLCTTEDRRILVSQRSNVVSSLRGLWQFPGGGLDEEVDEVATDNLIKIHIPSAEHHAIWRELREETGILVDDLRHFKQMFKYIGWREDIGYYQGTMFHLACANNTAVEYLEPTKSTPWEWVTFEQALNRHGIPGYREAIDLFAARL